MKLATLRIDGTTAAVRVDDTTATVIDGYPDLSALLATADWESLAQNASGGPSASTAPTTRPWCRAPARSSASG